MINEEKKVILIFIYMVLRISKRKIVYTLRDCIEIEYPELLERAISLSDNLLTFQNEILKSLPVLKQKLPTNIEQLKEFEAQFNLQNYIYLHSLFTYADKIWKLLDDKCRDLANVINNKDKYDIDDACTSLEEFLKLSENFSFSSMLNDYVTGLIRLDKKKVTHHWMVFKYYSFNDIIGSIISNGLVHEDLFRHSIDASIPTSSTIGVLLDDDKMIRVY